MSCSHVAEEEASKFFLLCCSLGMRGMLHQQSGLVYHDRTDGCVMTVGRLIGGHVRREAKNSHDSLNFVYCTRYGIYIYIWYMYIYMVYVV